MKLVDRESIEKAQVPELLDRSKLAELLAQAMLGLLEEESTSLLQLADFLESPEVHEIIDR
jgi:2-C-methyl-D-erythritol 4-phosphate cytidylyltransferase